MKDGRRFLITHGDKFDAVMNYAKWLAKIGDYAYSIAIMINVWFNTIRRRLNLPYWSLSAYLKHKVKNAVEFIGHYEVALAAEARRHNVHGVICGHIHHAEIRDINGITYCNDGDWVESCTALVEHENGELEILDWSLCADLTATAARTRSRLRPARPGRTRHPIVKILFITDAWHPQINGVVRTLSTTGKELEKMGHTVGFIGPDQFRTDRRCPAIRRSGSR